MHSRWWQTLQQNRSVSIGTRKDLQITTRSLSSGDETTTVERGLMKKLGINLVSKRATCGGFHGRKREEASRREIKIQDEKEEAGMINIRQKYL